MAEEAGGVCGAADREPHFHFDAVLFLRSMVVLVSWVV